MVGSTTHGKEQIAEAIHPADRLRRHRFGMVQMHHQPFRPTTNCPSDVQTRGKFAPSRKNETSDFRRRGLIMIDQPFQYDDVGIVDAADLVTVSSPFGRGQIGAEIERS